MTSERLTLTVEQAAQLLGVSRGTAYAAVKTGDIPSIRVGRRLLIPTRALMALVGVPDTPDLEAAPVAPEKGEAPRLVA